MSEGTIGLIIIAVFVAVLLFGFLFGLWRGFNKSLIRLLFVVASIVGAFFLAPVVTKWALTLDLSNFGIKVAGESVSTLGELLRALLKDVPYISDLAGTQAYETILEVVPQMIANVVLFVVLFYLIRLVSMIIYWIIVGIAFSKKKTEGKNKHRLLGSIVGVVQNFAVFLVLLVPVIGVVNIIGTIETITTQEQSSSASTARTTISDDNSYVVLMEGEESEGEGSSETPASEDSAAVKVYKTVNEVIDIYKNTWVAKFLHAVKIDTVCEGAFDKLSTVEKDGEKFVLKEEAASVAYVYNDIKDIKDVGGFDIKNPKIFEILENVIDHAYKSKLTAKTVNEVIPLAITKWQNGETFLGLTKQDLFGNLEEPYASIVDTLLNEFTDTTKTLSETLKSTASMMKSLAATASKIEEAIGDLSAETATDLLKSLTDTPETLELVKEVLLTPVAEGEQSNLEKLADEIFGEDESAVKAKNVMLEVVNSVLSADYQAEENNLENEIAVVGSALDLADKLSNTDSEEVTPEVVKESVNQIIGDLNNSTVILETLSNEGGSDLKDAINDAVEDVSAHVEGYEDLKDWISDAIEGLEDQSKAATLYEIFGLTPPTE